jgi:RasGEF N-terminal motif
VSRPILPLGQPTETIAGRRPSLELWTSFSINFFSLLLAGTVCKSVLCSAVPSKTFVDPGFVAHFLLTYRRFTTPRTILLAMQKRMRQLDNPSDDPMFACFAQMRYKDYFSSKVLELNLLFRICHLLEAWIRDYPDDFAVKGTAGALTALIKSIISKTHLLHYGSEFLPFLEMLPSLTDQTAWALKADVSAEESDDSYSFMEDEEEIEPPPREVTDSPVSNKSPTQEKTTQPHLRERKSSLPLTKFGVGASSPSTPSPKQQLKELVRLANDVLACDVIELAQEITRQWVKLFMAIKVRLLGPRSWPFPDLLPAARLASLCLCILERKEA